MSLRYPNVTQLFLLRMKYPTKWAFIEVLNPRTKLYKDIWKDEKKLNLEVKKKKKIVSCSTHRENYVKLFF